MTNRQARRHKATIRSVSQAGLETDVRERYKAEVVNLILEADCDPYKLSLYHLWMSFREDIPPETVAANEIEAQRAHALRDTDDWRDDLAATCLENLFDLDPPD